MPKIVDKPQRRREIAQAALELFSKKGFTRTSVREIAEACEMAKGSIYDYFANKEDVLEELVSMALADWRDEVSRLRESSLLPDQLIRELLANTVSRMAQRNSSLLMFFAFLRRDEPTQPQQERLLTSIQALSAETAATLEEWLNDGIQRGVFSPSICPAQDAAALMGAMDGLFLRHRQGLEPYDLSKGLHRFLDVYLDGLSA